MDHALAENPFILAAERKIEYYEVGQRLKQEKLKPKLKVRYNPILATPEVGLTPSFSGSDLKWGFDFSFPLFVRTEKAELQKGLIRLRDLALDLENKRNQLENKLDGSLRQLVGLADQLTLLQQNIVRYRILLDGENEKFRLGESSVFFT